MANEQRQTLNYPDRDRPDRNAHRKMGGTGEGSYSASNPNTADDAISNAVHMAYEVVEENIRQGSRAAEALRAGSFRPSDISDSAKIVASRLMHLTMELGTTWIGLIGAIARDPELRAAFGRPPPPQSRPHDESAGAAHAAQAPVSYRVSSRKPTEVTLSPLVPLGHPVVPAVAGLFSLNPDVLPIHGVVFTVGPDGGLKVSIDIDDGQPHGAYAGTVVDRDSRQPIGTLSVRIFE